MENPTYYPVWVDEDGTEWTEEALWEQCEFGCRSFDPDSFSPASAAEGDLQEFAGTCTNPAEIVGQRGNIRIQLCGAHFSAIKSRCRVRWDEFIC